MKNYHLIIGLFSFPFGVCIVAMIAVLNSKLNTNVGLIRTVIPVQASTAVCFDTNVVK